jgi:hypothetical protein
MAFRVATLCKTEGIPPELVCNLDQTAIHFRPSTEQTYEVKGVKEVKCLGKDDKRQITAVVSSTASGELVPLQLVFQGKTKAVVPKDEDAKRAVAMGCHLTMSENHWSNFVTMKSFVEKVLDLWHVKKCEELGLAPDSQKMVWLINCWKVHISAGFREWMLDLFPFIKTMFVPANCTNKLQVANVVLQRPLKHRFRQQFNIWQAQQVALQVLGKVEPKDIKLDLGVKELQGKVVG